MSVLSIVENRDILNSLSQLLLPENTVLNERSSLKRENSTEMRQLAELNQHFQSLRLSQEMMSIPDFYIDSYPNLWISSYHYDSPHFEICISSFQNNVPSLFDNNRQRSSSAMKTDSFDLLPLSIKSHDNESDDKSLKTELLQTSRIRKAIQIVPGNIYLDGRLSCTFRSIHRKRRQIKKHLLSL